MGPIILSAVPRGGRYKNLLKVLRVGGAVCADFLIQSCGLSPLYPVGASELLRNE